MSVALEPEPEFPPPSPELVLIRVFVCSYLATAHEKPRRRARALLDHAAKLMRDEESLAELFPMKRHAQQAAHRRARLLAINLFWAYWPLLNATLPEDT